MLNGLVLRHRFMNRCPTTRFLRLSSTRKANTQLSSEDIATARAWIAKLTPTTIPRNIGEVTYSRSSGPGGQNVNKVNSKATLKIPLESLLKIVPHPLHAEIRSSRYVTRRSESLLVQSDDTRSQSSNADRCFEKLSDLLVDVGKAVVSGETSPEQKRKVKDLQKSGNEARLQKKKIQSSKKSSRKASKYDD